MNDYLKTKYSFNFWFNFSYLRTNYYSLVLRIVLTTTKLFTTSNKSIMNVRISFLSFLILLFLSSSPINTIQASAVPASTNANRSNQKNKNKKNRIKKHRKKQFKNTKIKEKGTFLSTLSIILTAAWYPISIGLLITALVLGITPLLIVSIILLALPVAIALILGIIFLILLFTSTGDWC